MALLPQHSPSYSVSQLSSSFLQRNDDNEIHGFEDEICKYLGCKYAILVSKARVGLYLILKALELEGSEVITPAFNCLVVPNSLYYAGVKPLYCDIDLLDYNLCEESLEGLIAKDAKAILPLHLYGNPCDMKKVSEIAHSHDLLVIEDAAQALGASQGGRNAGTLGDVGIISFDLYKNYTTVDGGVVVTDNEEIAAKVRGLNQQLRSSSPIHNFKRFARGMVFKSLSHPTIYPFALNGMHTIKRINPNLGPGGVSRVEKKGLGELPSIYGQKMSSWQAGFGRKRFKDFEKEIEARRSHAKIYKKVLGENQQIILPAENPKSKHAYTRYTVRVAGMSRGDILSEMRKRGVDCGVWFDYIVHPNRELWGELGYKKGLCPASEQASWEVFDLPIYPTLSRKEIEDVAHALLSCVRNKKV